ncbi:hypothetical protein AAFF_G00000760 [Aldrovandia affinis]|uniref:Uncharacterized protein n=1 Tax=Aldrovandia affinis TaxID=143900 RepID=A0AAD7TCS5_9TELE|nr:hypothetical protein AAFF_G00000760 [Aldrovandia affinis]
MELTDWSIFKNPDLDVYASHVIGYTNRLVDECIPAKLVRSFPNCKPWMNSDIRSKQREQCTAFKSGNTELYRMAKYDLRRAIKTAKKDYKNKLESQYGGGGGSNSSNSRRMWKGLRALTNDKGSLAGVINTDPSHPDELNTFYACFERENTMPALKPPPTQRTTHYC